MKNLIQAVVVAAALAAPVAVFAQDNAPLTRAQVRAELVQLEKAGYKPAVGEDPHYPEALQAAEARVAQQQVAQGADQSGYGGQPQGVSAAGSHAPVVRPATDEEMKSLYRGS